MAITRESIIQNLYSTTVSAVPDASLELGEIAINTADEAVFIKNSGGAVKKLSATSDLTTNLVTISTTQTVSGDKTFSGTVTMNNGLVFEGATADGFETTLTVVDPTADQTITLPNLSGTVGLVPGSTTEVVYNNAGALGSSATFTYDSGANTLEIDGGHVRADFLGAVQIEVRNETGVSIAKGTPVYATGYSGGRVLIAPADASDSAKMPAVGIVDDAIADSNNGHATVLGIFRNIDTSTYSINQTLYVASGGGLTNSRPTSSSVLVQNMGKVVSVGSNGEIVVFGPGRTNDVPNTIAVNGDVVFEGATQDAFETTLTVVDPTADRTITLPNATGTVALVAGSDTQVMFNDGGTTLGGDAGLTYNKTTDTLTVGSLVSTAGLYIDGAIVFTFEGVTADNFETQMLVGEPTQDNFIYFPNSSGYVALVPGSDTQVMFNDGGTTLGGDSGFTYNKSTDTLTLGGDIAVNGGDLTTTAGTASVFNTNATTLNIGQAATQINLGASSGDVDIAGALQTVDEVVVGTVLGVNKTDPQYAADVNSSSGACLRLIYNSSSGTPTNYVLFAVSSSGDLTLTPSGGDVSMNANMGMNDKTLSRAELFDYFERYQLTSLTKGGGLTLDLSLGQVIKSDLSANITSITISNIPDNGNSNAVGFTLILVADGTARSVTWPVSVKWPGGTAPTLTSTNGKADIFSFVSTDAGTNWYGFVGGQNF